MWLAGWRQFLAKLPSIMLPTSVVRILCCKLVTFSVTISIVNCVYVTRFVTANKRHVNWTVEEFPEPTVETYRRGRTTEEHTGNYWQYDQYGGYQMRFKPVPKLKRLFWHKFPQAQQEEPTEAPQEPMITTTPAVQPEPEPEQPEPEPVTEPPVTEPPVTVSPITMLPTEMQPVVTVMPTMPNSTSFPMSTTTRHTMIMRPNTIPPHLSNTLKQLLLFGSPLEANLIEKHPAALKIPTASKGKGFLSLFEVIKFENNKCSVAMGDIRTMEGVCYHEFECKSLGGITTERCAEGVGVCCIFLTGCGESTNQPIVYFESPNYPNAVREMMICVLIVNVREKVQQLRLDFLMFELNRPTNGDCLDDQFIVSGQDMNFIVPVLCGINTGQHIYINVANAFEKKIYLSFFAKVASGGRSFNIKVTQLESDFAPDGCLQYFKDPEGMVKSFNYDIDGTIVDNREATYLNNLNYVICIQRAKETCSVTYLTEMISGDQLDFQIVNKDEDGNDLVPDGQAGAGIFNCPDDFIAINQVRLCGERFNDGIASDDYTENAPVKDIAAGPIILPFRSDAEFVGRGFRLAYKQEKCG